MFERKHCLQCDLGGTQDLSCHAFTLFYGSPYIHRFLAHYEVIAIRPGNLQGICAIFVWYTCRAVCSLADVFKMTPSPYAVCLDGKCLHGYCKPAKSPGFKGSYLERTLSSKLGKTVEGLC